MRYFICFTNKMEQKYSLDLKEVVEDPFELLLDPRFENSLHFKVLLGGERFPLTGSFPVIASRSPFVSGLKEDINFFNNTDKNPLRLLSSESVTTPEGDLKKGFLSIWKYLNGFDISNYYLTSSTEDTFITVYYLLTYFALDFDEKVITLSFENLFFDLKTAVENPSDVSTFDTAIDLLHRLKEIRFPAKLGNYYKTIVRLLPPDIADSIIPSPVTPVKSRIRKTQKSKRSRSPQARVGVERKLSF